MNRFRILAFVGRRLLQSVPTLIGIVVLNFFLLHMAPGDPAEVLAGEAGGAPPEYVAEMRQRFGLDKPLPVQFLAYAKNILSLDLGYSYRNSAKVSDLILERIGPTLLLTTTALALSLLMGVLLGVFAAGKVNSVRDNLISVASVIAYATPLFWIGLMLILVFSVWLDWLPAAGMEDVTAFNEGWARVVDIARHLVLPCVTLALFYTAVYTRLTRATMIDQRGLDYITTARAKGLLERTITARHAFPNAVLPVITMAGVQAGALLGGSVIIETVFAWPGLGQQAFQALFARDLSLLLGIFFLSGILVILVNILVDVVYLMIDPRIAAR